MSQDQGGASEAENSESALDSVTGRLSLPGELFVAIGALVILGVDLIGDIFMDEYSISTVAWIAALLIVLNVAAHRWGNRSLAGNYSRTLMVLALVVAAVTFREILEDARDDNLDGGVTTLWAVIYTIGGVVALIGTWQLWDSGSENAGD